MCLYITLSIFLIFIGAIIIRVWCKEKLPDAFISLLTTFIAALLALVTYLFGVQLNDRDARIRLARLFQAELAEAQRAVSGNAAQAKEIGSAGISTKNLSYTICPKVIAAEILKSGLFPDNEERILDYLSAANTYNHLMDSAIVSASMLETGEGSSSLVGGSVVKAAVDVNNAAIELLTEIKDSTEQK